MLFSLYDAQDCHQCKKFQNQSLLELYGSCLYSQLTRFRTEPSLMTCVISRLNYALQSCNLDQTVVERGVYPDVCSSNNTSLHTVGLTAQLQYLLTLLPITHCSVAAYAVLSVKANWTRSSNPIYSSRGIRW